MIYYISTLVSRDRVRQACLATVRFKNEMSELGEVDKLSISEGCPTVAFSYQSELENTLDIVYGDLSKPVRAYGYDSIFLGG